MVGKIKPRKVIMPSDLTGNRKRTRRSGPVFTYTVDLLPKESYQRLFADSFQYIKEEIIMEELNSVTKNENMDLQQLNNDKQRDVLLQMVKEGKSDEEMGELFGLTQWQVRNLRYKAGIKKDRGGNIHLLSQEQRANNLEWRTQGLQKIEPETTGLTLSIRGSHTGEESVRRLNALAALVGANIPDKKYSLSVQLTEIIED